jgi:hypothetical protein
MTELNIKFDPPTAEERALLEQIKYLQEKHINELKPIYDRLIAIQQLKNFTFFGVLNES